MIKNSVLNKSMINKSTTKMQPPPEQQPPQGPPEQPPQEPPEQGPPQGPHPPFQEEVTDRMIDRHFCFFARDPLDRNSDLMIWNSFSIAILSIERTRGSELLAGSRAARLVRQEAVSGPISRLPTASVRVKVRAEKRPAIPHTRDRI